jgi:hypothetical protein
MVQEGDAKDAYIISDTWKLAQAVADKYVLAKERGKDQIMHQLAYSPVSYFVKTRFIVENLFPRLGEIAVPYDYVHSDTAGTHGDYMDYDTKRPLLPQTNLGQGPVS